MRFLRGITLANGDSILSMTIVRHVDAEPWERAAYLKRSAAERRFVTGEAEEIALVGEEVTEEGQLSDERYEELKALEQFVLTVSEKGFGKRPRRKGYPGHRHGEDRRDRQARRRFPG